MTEIIVYFFEIIYINDTKGIVLMWVIIIQPFMNFFIKGSFVMGVGKRVVAAKLRKLYPGKSFVTTHIDDYSAQQKCNKICGNCTVYIN